MIMAKKQKQPQKTCSDCIHESACRIWTDGRYISDESASKCLNHETVKESSAYLCGVLDERKRKSTNADRIRAMSDDELGKWLTKKFADLQAQQLFGESPAPTATALSALSHTWYCQWMYWLKQPAKDGEDDGR